MIRNKILPVIILSIAIVFAGLYYFLFSGPSTKLETERVVFSQGATQEEIVSKLKKEGYIRSEWAFEFVLEKKGWENKIEPGGYEVSKNMNVWTLAETLVNFPSEKWVVVPEGLRKEQVAKIVKEKLGWPEDIKKEFLSNSEEGYLFPDTYLLRVSNLEGSGKLAAQRMQNRFNEELSDLFEDAREKNIRNDTLVILASIVQREASRKEDMSLVSGIIWNRWLNNIKFEVDATVQYALGEPGDWWPTVTLEDYKFESPYNTYLYEGRPPGPICNPGFSALKSVIYPEESDYFYYIHDSEGEIHPAKTYSEHRENVEKYLQKSDFKI